MSSPTRPIGPYRIERFEPQTRVLEHLSSPLVKASIVLSLVLELTYLLVSCYVGATIPASRTNGAFPWRVWAIIVAQILLCIVDIQARFDQYVPLILGIKLQDRPRYRLVGNEVPKVDVCIMTCGEEVNIVMYTVAAAAALYYPSNRFEVFLLDDGKSAELREAVKIFNVKQGKVAAKEVTYLSRTIPPGMPTHYKAGNQNFGIYETKKLSGAHFMATLDVDMIPHPEWLRAMLPHLLLDEKVGIATPPQSFYNLPDRDVLTQGPSIPRMYNRILRDGFGNASCDGSGFVMRREAIEMIGGWPTHSVSDDSLCSEMLLAAGWKLAIVNEKLQTGIQPDTMAGYLKQRMRWKSGNVEVARLFNFYLPGRDISAGLTLPQRLSSCIDSLKEYMAFLVFLSAILLPTAFWPTGSNDLSTLVSKPSRRLLGWTFLISYIASRLNNYIVYGRNADEYAQNGKRVKFWTVPYGMLAVLRVYCPGAQILSTPTGTVSSNLKERSRIHRRPFTQRFLSSGTTMHFIYVVMGVTCLYLRVRKDDLARGEGYGFPFAGALFQWAECVVMVSTPLWYMAFPPTVPELKDILEEGEDGLTRPRTRVREPNYVSNMMWAARWDVVLLALCVS